MPYVVIAYKMTVNFATFLGNCHANASSVIIIDRLV